MDPSPSQPSRRPLIYPVPEGSQTVDRELPFVLGVLGDFAGDAAGSLPPLGERRFLSVDLETFDEVLAHIAPRLRLVVGNALDGGETEMPVDLRFRSLRDFEPAGIIQQVEPLRKLLEARKGLAASPTFGAALRSQDSGLASLLDRICEAEPEGGSSLRPVGVSPLSRLDDSVSRQLRWILHAPEFQRLEASWRGLHYLVRLSRIGANLRIKVLHASWQELSADLEKAGEFDRSRIWATVCASGEGAGGSASCCSVEPFSVLIGDYAFACRPQDLGVLKAMSEMAAATSCPFISAVSLAFFGRDESAGLPERWDLAALLEDAEYVGWRAFRDSAASRFVALSLPRVLARLPHRALLEGPSELEFLEFAEGLLAEPRLIPDEQLCWMSSAYVLGARLAHSFAGSGWFSWIAGEGGWIGTEELPYLAGHRTDVDADTDAETKGPTEVRISGRLGHELANSGFVPLVGPDSVAHGSLGRCPDFVLLPSAHRPADYGPRNRAATDDSALAANLICVLTVSRFAQAIEAIARQSLRAGTNAESCESRLSRWLAAYVACESSSNEEAPPGLPLAEGRIEVAPCPGRAGSLRIVAHLRPRVLSRELARPLRISMEVP